MASLLKIQQLFQNHTKEMLVADILSSEVLNVIHIRH